MVQIEFSGEYTDLPERQKDTFIYTIREMADRVQHGKWKLFAWKKVNTQKMYNKKTNQMKIDMFSVISVNG